MPQFNIALIGYGKMGAALHRGWMAGDIDARYHIISPSQTRHDEGICSYYSSAEDAAAALEKADLVMLAVKPQIMGDVCAQVSGLINDKALILSIAAGLTLNWFSNYFPAPRAVCRSMPNTPSAIGKGIAGYVLNQHCSADHSDLVERLLKCSGSTVKLADETQMDALTSVSGSGPAYLFYFTEMLAKAGQAQGLSAQDAMALARQTVIGAAALMEADAGVPASTLRENVTSKGGTTQAALSHLMDGRMQEIMDEALRAAVDRARKL